MNSLASDLKTEREKRNISLERIAEETRISLRHLQSLEEGRYSDLPGGIYNRAFLKAYCETLNLDSHEIIQRYEAELSPHPEKTARFQPHLPSSKPFWGSNPIFAWSLMFLISAAAIFFNRNWFHSVFSPYYSHTPASVSKYAAVPEPIVQSNRTDQHYSATSGQAAVEPTSASASKLETAETSLQAAFPASDSSQSLRIELEVTEKCWVSVDSDGGRVVRKVLEPGEAQSFNAAEQFFIVIGNAGGVHLRINGQPAKPLGKPGEVVKMRINTKNLPEYINQTTG
jgi:cytoskeleton protein RodZ